MVNGFRPAFALLLCSVTLALAPVASPGQVLSESPQNELLHHFRAGQADLQVGKWTESIQEFKKVLQLDPDLVEAQVNLGLAYQALGEYSLAVSQFSRALKLKPNLLAANLFLGVSYLKLGSPGKAIVPLDRALHIDPSNRVGRRALATAQLSVGNFGEAARQFRKLASTDPQEANRWFTLGEDYLRLSKLLTTELSAQFAHSVWSYRLAGDVLCERQLWNDAASAYRKALQAGPAPEGLHADLGMALLGAHKTADAASEFRIELARNPSDPSALLGMAEVDLLKGNVSSTLEWIRMVWKTEPAVLVRVAGDFPTIDLPQANARQALAALNAIPAGRSREFLRAATFRILGEHELARREVEKLESSAKVEIASMRKQGVPSRSDCEHRHARLCVDFLVSQKDLQFGDRLRLGQDFLRLGQTQTASNTFAAALQQNRKDPEALYWLNRSYLLLSEEYFNRLMTSYPHSWRTHELEAEALHLRQADEGAIKEYRVAEKLNPRSPRIRESLGEILLDQRKFEEAKTELQTALRLNPASARSLYLMGRLYVDQREPAKGIPFLKSALEHDPTLLEARPVLGKAYLKVGKPSLAIPQLERASKIDHYGDLHYQLYEAYRQEGRTRLAAQALARSQELRRQSAAEDQAKIRSTEQ